MTIQSDVALYFARKDAGEHVRRSRRTRKGTWRSPSPLSSSRAALGAKGGMACAAKEKLSIVDTLSQGW